MCCYRTGECKIATEDITCFKVVLGGIPGHFTSLYQGFTYTEGVEYHKSHGMEQFNDSYSLKGEGFHSYIDYPDGYWYNSNPFKCIVICTIPKGSKYYEGFDDSGNDCYCSDKIKIDRLCAPI